MVEGLVGRWMDGWVDEWMDGCMDGWMDGWLYNASRSDAFYSGLMYIAVWRLGGQLGSRP